MTRLTDYEHRYRNIAFERTATGILTMRLHRDGGPLKWSAIEGGAHDQIGAALWDVGHDPENKIVILTGTGESFLMERDPDEYPPHDAENWFRLTREGRDILTGFLEIDRPVITIANGPATFRPEIPMMGDVVLAADDAYFQDSHIRRGLVPSDGCHTVWLELLGTNRGRYFLMTSQKLTAQELNALGAISEVLPRDRLIPRAFEIAEQWATLPSEVVRWAHVALTQTYKRRVLDEVAFGHAVEGLGMYASVAVGSDPLQSRAHN
jgi:enoyl-CoA hydratase/carnithine racemase